MQFTDDLLKLEVTYFKTPCQKGIYIVLQDKILGMPLNRKDAVAYLKELLIQCKEMSPEAVTFQVQNPNTTDYRVLIKGSMNSTDKAAVKEIAKKYSYQIKEDFDGIEIYNIM